MSSGSPVTFTVTPAAGYTGTFKFNSTGTNSITVNTASGTASEALAINSWTATTDVNTQGQATQAGLYTITATTTALGLTTTLYSAPGGLTVTGAQNKLIFESAPGVPLYSSSPTYYATTAGVCFHAYVQVADAANIAVTPLAPITVTLSLAGGGKFIVNGNAVSTVTAVASNTGSTIGLASFMLIIDAVSSSPSGWTMNASANVPVGASALVNVSAASASKLSFSTLPTGTVAATTTFAAGVKVTDQYGNAVSGGTVDLTPNYGTQSGIPALDGSHDPVTAVVGSNGIASFTGLSITTTGTYGLQASLEGSSLVTTANVTIGSGVVSQLVMSSSYNGIANPTSIQAGQVLTFTVTPEDADGNVVTGSNDNFTLALAFGSKASGDLISTNPNPTAGNSFTTTAFNGGKTGTETFYAVFGTTSESQAGALQDITVTDSAHPSASNTVTPFTVLSGQVASLAISGVTAVTNGGGTTVTPGAAIN